MQRFEHQLKVSGLKIEFTSKPDFSWSCSDISDIKSKFNLNEYILLFPFCSPHLRLKQWPYFNELIKEIKNEYKSKYKIIIAPGPDEIKDSEKINADCILDNGKALNISQLSSLIKASSFVIANDTGPAHMSAHLDVKGITLFGSHTTAYKVSIERDKFKPIQVHDLKKLSPEKVFEKLQKYI